MPSRRPTSTLGCLAYISSPTLPHSAPHSRAGPQKPRSGSPITAPAARSAPPIFDAVLLCLDRDPPNATALRSRWDRLSSPAARRVHRRHPADGPTIRRTRALAATEMNLLHASTAPHVVFLSRPNLRRVMPRPRTAGAPREPRLHPAAGAGACLDFALLLVLAAGRSGHRSALLERGNTNGMPRCQRRPAAIRRSAVVHRRNSPYGRLRGGSSSLGRLAGDLLAAP